MLVGFSPSRLGKPLSLGAGLLLGRDARKLGWQPLCIFCTIWLKRNSIAFDNKEFSMPRMKSSFVYHLWSWTNLYMVDGPSSLVDFLTWLSCK